MTVPVLMTELLPPKLVTSMPTAEAGSDGDGAAVGDGVEIAEHDDADGIVAEKIRPLLLIVPDEPL